MNRLKKVLAASDRSNISAGSRIVSLLSGKGGVGKSVIAFNLAERAAATGCRVMLVDADLCCGNQHILANVDPRSGLEAFVTKAKPLSEAAVRYNENLDILARSETGPLEMLDSVSAVARCAARLRQEAVGYDLVVIDHSSGISAPATVFANASDLNLLLLIPELTSVSDCYGLCKYLYQSNHAIDCRLLLNRTDSSEEAEYIWTKFAAVAEQFFARVPSLAGSLPEDRAVRQAVGEQRPIVEIAPESPVVQALEKIARDLARELAASIPGNTTKEINSVTAPADIKE